MADECECVCNYIWAMHRLLSWLQTQNHCSDTECFTEHPGYEGGTGSDSSMLQFAMVVVLWIIIALLLFLFRPASLRTSNKKPSLPHNDRRQPPSPSVQ